MPRGYERRVIFFAARLEGLGRLTAVAMWKKCLVVLTVMGCGSSEMATPDAVLPDPDAGIVDTDLPIDLAAATRARTGLRSLRSLRRYRPGADPRSSAFRRR
jgi:hypothetical protein